MGAWGGGDGGSRQSSPRPPFQRSDLPSLFPGQIHTRHSLPGPVLGTENVNIYQIAPPLRAHNLVGEIDR